ncbi:MAG: hypothetical protein Q4B22_08320 [Eubacteriales bacterium]|nr:hypothetical protein [Eubacteriales bacterium]
MDKMSLHKSYYFIYTGCAMYMCNYIYGNPKLMSMFMPVFNLTSIFGVTLGGIWKSIFSLQHLPTTVHEKTVHVPMV